MRFRVFHTESGDDCGTLSAQDEKTAINVVVRRLTHAHEPDEFTAYNVGECPECGAAGVESNEPVPRREIVFKCCHPKGCGHEWGPGTEV